MRLLSGSIRSGFSDAAITVHNRMSSLSSTEKNAIAAFVDSIDAAGDWDKCIDVFCFALNSTDALKGFVSHTATNSSMTHGSDGYSSTADTHYIDTTIVPNTSFPATGKGTMAVYAPAWGSAGGLNTGVMGNASESATPTGNYLYCQYRQTSSKQWGGSFNGGGVTRPSHSYGTEPPADETILMTFDGSDVRWRVGTDAAAVDVGYTYGARQTDSICVPGYRAYGGSGVELQYSGTTVSLFAAFDDLINETTFRTATLDMLRTLGVSGVPSS